MTQEESDEVGLYHSKDESTLTTTKKESSHIEIQRLL